MTSWSSLPTSTSKSTFSQNIQMLIQTKLELTILSHKERIQRYMKINITIWFHYFLIGKIKTEPVTELKHGPGEKRQACLSCEPCYSNLLCFLYLLWLKYIINIFIKWKYLFKQLSVSISLGKVNHFGLWQLCRISFYIYDSSKAFWYWYKETIFFKFCLRTPFDRLVFFRYT